MARAVTIYRNSADDRRGPAASSPFRSESDQARYLAAQEMVAKREHELAGLQDILARTKDRSTRKILTQRISATRNNLSSWLRYIEDDAPRDKRAVVTPPKKTRKRVAKTA